MFANEGGHPRQGVSLVQAVVRAQKEQPRSGGQVHAAVHGVVDALVGVAMNDQPLAEVGGENVGDVEGFVRRAAVDQYQLEVTAGLTGDAVEAGRQYRSHVQGGDDDRKHWCGHGDFLCVSCGQAGVSFRLHHLRPRRSARTSGARSGAGPREAIPINRPRGKRCRRPATFDHYLHQ